MKTLLFVANLFVAITLSGCLTLINTKGKQMYLDSNVPGAKVTLDGNEVGVTPLTLKMSRKVPFHEISVTSPGFKEERFLAYRQQYAPAISGSYIVLGTSCGGAAMGLGAYVAAGTSENGAKIAFGASLAILTFIIVDLATGAVYEFPKSYTSRLVSLPMAIDTENCNSFFVDQIEFEIEKDERLGKMVKKSGKDQRIYLYGPGAGTSFLMQPRAILFQPDISGTTSRITKAFEDAKFNVVDVQKTHATTPRYRLTAEVDSIGIHALQLKNSANSLTDSKVSVTWKLWTPKSDRTPIGTWQFAGETKQDLQAPFDCVEKAILRSAYQLMDDPGFRTALQSNGTAPLPAEVDSIAVMIAPAPSYPVKLNEIAKSVLTVNTDFGHGSGFFISADGYVLTNYHVIEGSKEIKVEMQQGLSLPAKVVKVDKTSDLALLRVDGSGFVPLKLAIGKAAELGEDIHAIGTPLDKNFGQTITKGIISGSRTVEGEKYLQIDASVNAGNSGGPLLNASGEVIGIVNAKVAKAGVEGIGFAIPIEVAIAKLNLKF